LKGESIKGVSKRKANIKYKATKHKKEMQIGYSSKHSKILFQIVVYIIAYG